MFAEIFASTEALKLLFFLAVACGLLLLARWSSRLGATSLGDASAGDPNPDSRHFISNGGLDQKVSPPSADEIAASLPFDPSLGKLQIKKFYFDKTDVSPQPSDADVFADDLNVELYDPDTGHDWWQSFFIATPQGLAKILRDKHWRYLHAPQILVFPRYDLEEIRRAVVTRIVTEHAYYKGLEKTEEESL